MNRWWTGIRRWVLLQVARVVSGQVRRLCAELAVEQESYAAVMADFEAETSDMRAAHEQALADRDQQIADFRREVAGLEAEVEHWKAEAARERRLGNAAWQRLARLHRVGTTSGQPEQLTDLREEKKVRT